MLTAGPEEGEHVRAVLRREVALSRRTVFPQVSIRGTEGGNSFWSHVALGQNPVSLVNI